MIPHVKELAILNDCEENHKLLKKPPEWIVHKGNQIVVEELDTSGSLHESKKIQMKDFPSELRLSVQRLT